MPAKIYRAGWEAVCEECPDSSGLYNNDEREKAAEWVRDHNKTYHGGPR